MRRMFNGSIALLLSMGLLAGIARAEDSTAAPKKEAAAKKAATTKPARIYVPPDQPADQPFIKGEAGPNNPFVKRHEGLLEDLKAMNGKCDIVFLGDSITDAWRHPRGENEGGKQGGKEVFDKYYGAMKPLNLGIGGDRTQHVIWRLDNGEVDGISPKVVMLMIGTNNLGTNTNEQIITADAKIVQILHEKLPHTKVLLLGVFPRSVKANGQYRSNIKAINEGLSKLDDGGKTVKYLDIGEKFLDAEGTLSPDIMPDALHPNAKGYEIWAKAIQPTLDELMK